MLQHNNENKRFHATMKTNASTQQCNGDVTMEELRLREELCSETRIDRTHPLCSECNLGVWFENRSSEVGSGDRLGADVCIWLRIPLRLEG
jgi:hypothetical protein